MNGFTESARAKYQAAKHLRSKALASANKIDHEVKVSVCCVSRVFGRICSRTCNGHTPRWYAATFDVQSVFLVVCFAWISYHF
jgi:hypothetical protein